MKSSNLFVKGVFLKVKILLREMNLSQAFYRFNKCGFGYNLWLISIPKYLYSSTIGNFSLEVKSVLYFFLFN